MLNFETVNGYKCSKIVGVEKCLSDGEENEEMIETEMDDGDLENFKKEWEEKWNPLIREDEPGILTRFFTRMLNPF